MKLLAIDQGTTSTKAMLRDQNGTSRIILSKTHQQHYPKLNWVEHDPIELLDHIIECIHIEKSIDAIGLCNQGESCLAWNRLTGEPITPILVWQDNRGENIIDDLKKNGAEKVVLELAGLPLVPYFSASKFKWILDNVALAADLLAQDNLCLGTTDAFFLHRLTGQFVTDITTASRTSLMNLRTGEWDETLCNLFSIPINTLPKIRPSTGDFGTVRVENRDVPIVINVVDQQAALYGHGCDQVGDAKITFGTGAFVLSVSGSKPAQAFSKNIVSTIAWQKHKASPVFALEGGVYSAGAAINWGRSLGLFSDYAEINNFEKSSAIGNGLAFVPAFNGLASPFWDDGAAALFIGMDLSTNGKDMMQAILEGVAFRTKQVIDAMAEKIEICSAISIDGGLSNNPYFCQFLANILNKNIIVYESTELTAFGVIKLMSEQMSVEFSSHKIKLEYIPCADIDYDGLFDEALNRSRNWKNKSLF
ncbi:MAG: glycerol kinase [Alphaproteobacteria bacterium]|nr:glycerol kinase [Alphaproteobacteria bacterium]